MKTEYSQAVGFLESFIDYERMADFSYVKSFKLDRARRLLKDLGIDVGGLSVIHVAGTKGKGSTATFIAFILAGCGFKVGLYTSPHFHDFRERIATVRVQGSKVVTSFISKSRICRLVKETAPVAEKLRFDRNLGHLSFFEVYTALALKYFLEQDLDFVVLECGMGGRLDATNIAHPLVSVITHIGYDHTQYLGNSIKEIAHEKAGIIKKSTPVVSACQSLKAGQVLTRKTERLKSPLYMYKRDFSAADIRLNSGQTTFDLSTSQSRYPGLKIRLKGAHQIENACLAVVACGLLKSKYGVERAGIYKGLEQAYLKARFEILKSKGKAFLFDIAHNPSSMAVLDKAVKTYFAGFKVILVFGCSSDKDILKMLKNIDFNKALFTKSHNPRAQDPKVIKKISGIKSCFIERDLKKALNKARQAASKLKSIVVITGSIFLVAEAKEALRNET